MKMLLALAVAIAGACSINHKSSDFSCATSADCASGRTCVDSVCVFPGGGDDIDAPGPGSGSGSNHPDAFVQLDAPACPPQCTSCHGDNHECVIACGPSNQNCNAEVVCPPGWNCTIGCDVGNSCRNGIDCTQAASCEISCAGQSSCRNLDCGDGRCKVDCSGNFSCRNMTCADSCACDIACHQSSSCQNVACPNDCTGDFGFGCSSAEPQCNSCP